MSKRYKLIYWISTVWLSLGMLSSAIVQLMQLQSETAFIIKLGYPAYFLTIIGAWKILGVIALSIPGYLLLKEWVYAGFFFLMSGAVFSHLASGTYTEIFPSVLLLTLTVVSWFSRPPERRLLIA